MYLVHFHWRSFGVIQGMSYGEVAGSRAPCWPSGLELGAICFRHRMRPRSSSVPEYDNTRILVMCISRGGRRDVNLPYPTCFRSQPSISTCLWGQSLTSHQFKESTSHLFLSQLLTSHQFVGPTSHFLPPPL